ncbi:acyl-ACP--UDP-N-acetylglucosamine O-acyltransferase [Helicobacter ailurogastricus]|uniref:Acyl-[acyl-carrier-protein]--UDP-N-acetylglucosamine O-acyltransferase n=1 Tax=Helicobacter ailurogastricus TaxID=1578720 RepID=A0A0K2X9C0_9HELI|nr:acyl-ACP--UDP-N-acetylglucosamine O-acyltransferase [Helicobacter ailurogastricus]CRF40430.1 Acyl-[acyl-carrier-protein]--UDP-N-acetylglucosamine O-acyltransferase [Helicobacter ailurogastricus]CRF43402.1 Acyl-[acyl-carrier-protein]--UDP-N-acetylglucosamine O-acyltransferase [Helicobacter ailurogastricus]CRF43955.1 Acyl-[acyl-carrier-protein]--UDP-N-acetylglucosamine O-acyltransferase [Helicobacter ailurogastricus]
MIAPTAIIEAGAKIDPSVEVGHFCVIGANVVLEAGVKLYNNVTLLGHTTIGKDSTIFPYAVLGTIPQDLKYEGEESYLIVGERNLIREHCMINPGTKGGGHKTLIGNDNLLMAYVHVAHDCKIGNHCILANGVTLAGHIEIADYVNIGGLTAIHQFTRIAKGCMVAGASALGKDVPPYCNVEGNRAFIRGLNRHRMRKLLQSAEIDFINGLYKKLFDLETTTIRDNAQRILEEYPNNPHAKEICEFVLETERGIAIKAGYFKDQEEV